MKERYPLIKKIQKCTMNWPCDKCQFLIVCAMEAAEKVRQKIK